MKLTSIVEINTPKIPIPIIIINILAMILSSTENERRQMKQDAITNLSDKINYIILYERLDEITEKLMNVINSIF
jgi:hypothetical protein